MSKIDTLIQQLQEKKKKLDYLTYIKDLLKGDQHCVDYVEVQEEVLAKLLPLVDKLASEIEDSVETESQTPNAVGQFNDTELRALKMVASKLVEKAGQVQETPKQQQPPTQNNPTKNQKLPNQDKMSFAMDNRHLANKKVRVLHKDSDEVATTGTVVGLDAPNIVVKTVEGVTIEVPLSKILLGETA